MANHPKVSNKIYNHFSLQGVSYQSQLKYQPRRVLGTKHISIENSSPTDLAHFAITNNHVEEDASALTTITLGPGKSVQLSVNAPGETPQFIHILNKSSKYIGESFCLGPSYAIRSDAQSFVLRHGLNSWFVQPFVKGYSFN